MIRHIKDTDTGEKPKDKKEDVTLAGDDDVFGFSLPDEGTAPPTTDTGAAPPTLPFSETHLELLSNIVVPPVIAVDTK